MRGRLQVVRDLAGDALDGLLTRPMRTVLLALVFSVGCGGFVAAEGVNLTAAQQITRLLTPSDLDTVVVREKSPRDLPDDADGRASAIDDVLGAGRAWPLDAGQVSVSLLPRVAWRQSEPQTAPVYGADPAWIRLQNVQVRPDSGPDLLVGRAADHVALVGSALARRLSIPAAVPGVKIWAGSVAFDVVGIVGTGGRTPRLAESLVVSQGAIRALAPTQAGILEVRTTPGAAAAVAKVVAVTVLPEKPAALDVDPVLDIEQLRRGIRTDLDGTIALVSGLVIAFAALASANVMVVAVIARTPEIGLRRALGSSRSAVASLFLAEGAAIGLGGGLFGSVFGLLGVVLLAALDHWTPVLHPLTMALGPALGLLVGLVAACYPALRAAATAPASAVRHNE